MAPTLVVAAGMSAVVRLYLGVLRTVRARSGGTWCVRGKSSWQRAKTGRAFGGRARGAKGAGTRAPCSACAKSSAWSVHAPIAPTRCSRSPQTSTCVAALQSARALLESHVMIKNETIDRHHVAPAYAHACACGTRWGHNQPPKRV
jgi:hypothetical protein